MFLRVLVFKQAELYYKTAIIKFQQIPTHGYFDFVWSAPGDVSKK
jgi:hypothetical protein